MPGRRWRSGRGVRVDRARRPDDRLAGFAPPVHVRSRSREAGSQSGLRHCKPGSPVDHLQQHRQRHAHHRGRRLRRRRCRVRNGTVLVGWPCASVGQGEARVAGPRRRLRRVAGIVRGGCRGHAQWHSRADERHERGRSPSLPRIDSDLLSPGGPAAAGSTGPDATAQAEAGSWLGNEALRAHESGAASTERGAATSCRARTPEALGAGRPAGHALSRASSGSAGRRGVCPDARRFQRERPPGRHSASAAASSCPTRHAASVGAGEPVRACSRPAAIGPKA
jgi:hypothetical protein